jgi:hypothetical protein
MTAMRPLIVIAVVAAVVAGCNRGSNETVSGPAVAERPSEEGSAEARRDEAPGAARRERAVRDWSAFGMPVPEGAVAEEIGRTHAHYRLDVPVDEALAFFAGQLPDFTVTRYDQGVKLEASDRSDRALYLYASDGRSLLTYFDATPEAGADASRTPGGAPSRSAPTFGPDGATTVLSRNVPTQTPSWVGSASAGRDSEPSLGGMAPLPSVASRPVSNRGMGAANPRVPPPVIRGEYIPPRNGEAYY